MSIAYREDVEARPRRIDWANLDTAYGPAHSVPKWLWDLRFGQPLDAEEGGHMLWCSLCHHKGQLASAAEWALPFLLEFLPDVSEKLQNEILDILDGFALCSSSRRGYPAHGYHAAVRRKLYAALPLIQQFAEHSSEGVRGFAQEIVTEFEQEAPVEQLKPGRSPDPST